MFFVFVLHLHLAMMKHFKTHHTFLYVRIGRRLDAVLSYVTVVSKITVGTRALLGFNFEFEVM